MRKNKNSWGKIKKEVFGQRRKKRGFFDWSIADTLKTVIALFLATCLCFMFKPFEETTSYASMIYLLAVVRVASVTEGYVYGMAAAIISVVSANYLFTEPMFDFTLSVQGYSVSFVTTLTISMVISALTSETKEQEKLKAEAETEKMRSNLLRAVSHDIRTPLTSIIGTLSFLMANNVELTEEKKTELIKSARDEAEWLVRMTGNLLSATKMSDKNASINCVEEAVEEIVAAPVMRFKKRHPECKLSVKVPDELLMVPMDSTLIEQVITNILENAVMHGKTVTNIDFNVTSDGDYAVFSITDNGVGIAAEKLETVFEGRGSLLANNNNSKTPDKTKNVGIGLSVCRAIIKAHGGEIYAENVKDSGARFIFTLPLQNGKKGHKRK